MEPLTRKDVVSALGEVDDFIVTDIVATGATVQELAEAQAWLCSDEAMMNDGRPLAAGRVGQLIEILENIEEEQPGPAGHEVRDFERRPPRSSCRFRTGHHAESDELRWNSRACLNLEPA